MIEASSPWMNSSRASPRILTPPIQTMTGCLRTRKSRPGLPTDPGQREKGPYCCCLRLRRCVAGSGFPIDLLYVSTSFLWWQAVAGTIVVKSSQLVAHELAVHWATHGGPAERTKHLHQQHARPVAHVRQRQGRRPRLTPRGFTDQERPREQGQPGGRTREEQRHHRCTVPRDARPTRRSSFRLLAMASPHGMPVGSYGYDSTREEALEGHTVGRG